MNGKYKPLAGLPSFDMADLGMSSHFEIVLRCARTLLDVFGHKWQHMLTTFAL